MHFFKVYEKLIFKPIQDGGWGKKASPTSFSPVIFTNV